MPVTIKILIYVISVLHVFLVLAGNLPVSAGGFGVLVQFLYLNFLREYPELKLASPNFIAAYGKIFKATYSSFVNPT